MAQSKKIQKEATRPTFGQWCTIRGMAYKQVIPLYKERIKPLKRISSSDRYPIQTVYRRVFTKPVQAIYVGMRVVHEGRTDMMESYEDPHGEIVFKRQRSLVIWVFIENERKSAFFAFPEDVIWQTDRMEHYVRLALSVPEKGVMVNRMEVQKDRMIVYLNQDGTPALASYSIVDLYMLSRHLDEVKENDPEIINDYLTGYRKIPVPMTDQYIELMMMADIWNKRPITITEITTTLRTHQETINQFTTEQKKDFRRHLAPIVWRNLDRHCQQTLKTAYEWKFDYPMLEIEVPHELIDLGLLRSVEGTSSYIEITEFGKDAFEYGKA